MLMLRCTASDARVATATAEDPTAAKQQQRTNQQDGDHALLRRPSCWGVGRMTGRRRASERAGAAGGAAS